MNSDFQIENDVLVRYLARAEHIMIPDGITIIGAEAFKGCVSIKSIYMPDSVVYIRPFAFKGCKNLEKIHFSNHLRDIGEYAFHRCHHLKKITLPLSVKEIGNCSFLYCDQIEELFMWGVEKIGKQAFLNTTSLTKLGLSTKIDITSIGDTFTGCNKLNTFIFSDGSTYEIDLISYLQKITDRHPIIHCIVQDILRIANIEGTVLVKFLVNYKEVEIPEGIEVIGKSCFCDKKGIVKLKLPKSLKRIEATAFKNCINLETLALDTLNCQIEENAFKNCNNLRSIIMPDQQTYMLDGIATLADRNIPQIVQTIFKQALGNFIVCGTTLLKYNGSEERVTVPNGITTIGEKSFYGNLSIQTITLPTTVTVIAQEAFKNCELLQRITLSENTIRIDKSAFENCYKLLKFQFPSKIKIIDQYLFKRCKSLKVVLLNSSIEEIQEGAFYACTSLKEIIFPQSIRYIGDLAFYKSGLQEVSLLPTLQTLGNNIFSMSMLRNAFVDCNLDHCGNELFSYCEKLQRIDLGASVISISDRFAYGCVRLTDVIGTTQVESVGLYAFEKTKFIEKNKLMNNILLKYDTEEESVCLPEGIIGIAGGVFYDNKKINNVSLPSSLKNIGKKAFCNCENIKQITIPENIQVIQEGTFAYCSTLEDVQFLGAIQRIEKAAFYYCLCLKKMTLDNVVYIGESAFYNCNNLKDLRISQNCREILQDAFAYTKVSANTEFLIVADILVASQCRQNILSVPKGVKKIAPYVFANNTYLEKVYLPDTVSHISKGAFYGCTNLKSVSFSGKLEIIDESAFEKCTHLESLTVDCHKIMDKAFSCNIHLQKVVLVHTIMLGSFAFFGCRSLEVVQHDEIREVGSGCFQECRHLKQFDFYKIESFQEKSFQSCNELKNIYLRDQVKLKSHCFEDCSSLEEIYFETDYIFLDSYAFSGCTSVNSIIVGNEKHMLHGYSVLFDESIPDFVKLVYSNILSCFEIDEARVLCKYFNAATKVKIPQGILKINENVFKDHLNLEEIVIPSTVEYMGSRAFANTKWLEDQRKKEEPVVVNGILIDGCSASASVVIPENIRIVSGWAFVNHWRLKKIKFMGKNTIVEKYAFRNCIHLKQVVDYDNIVYDINQTQDIVAQPPDKVHQIFLDCYHCFKRDEQGQLVESTGNIPKLTLPKGITAIDEGVYKDAHLLTEITFTEDVTAIGKNAFENAKWLIEVKNAFGVEEIEKNAFKSCARLKKIELSNKLRFIGQSAFENCLSLEAIYIPEGVTMIPKRAFFRCKSLKEIILPSSVVEIEEEAFAVCENLERVLLSQQMRQIGERAFAWCLKATFYDIDTQNQLDGRLFERQER